MLDFKQPVSTWTALAYVAAGVVVGFLQGWTLPATVFAAAMALLAAGTAAMHARHGESWAHDLDHAGMNAAYGALATRAATGDGTLAALAMIAAAVSGALLVEAYLDRPNRELMGAFVWVTFVAGVTTGAVPMAVAGLILMGVGFLAHRKGGDYYHAAWHVLTAAGTALLYLGVA